jgi:transglutaminase-like putative cysteine protease
MGIRVALKHITEYRFDRVVCMAPHILRLRPASHGRAPVTRYSLDIHPRPQAIEWQRDPFGNHQARVRFSERVDFLTVAVDLEAEMTAADPYDLHLEPWAERYPFDYGDTLRRELRPYLEIHEPGPRLRRRLARIDRARRGAIAFLADLNAALGREIEYAAHADPGVHDCEQTLGQGRGACRDSAWLLIQLLRHLGLAARFVSGYLVQLVPDLTPLGELAEPPRDVADLHAWVEVFLPGAGWVGLDPTSGLPAGGGHIPLACAPKSADAEPVSGATDACRVMLRHRSTVRRLDARPCGGRGGSSRD